MQDIATEDEKRAYGGALALLEGASLTLSGGSIVGNTASGDNDAGYGAGIYVAGDITGVEEANTALEEGRLSGIDIAYKLGKIDEETAKAEKAGVWERLDGLRLGPHGEKRQEAKMNQIAKFKDVMDKEAVGGEA